MKKLTILLSSVSLLGVSGCGPMSSYNAYYGEGSANTLEKRKAQELYHSHFVVAGHPRYLNDQTKADKK